MRMEAVEAEQHKGLKRGLVYERKDSDPVTSRVWRRVNPAPKTYALVPFCVLATFALAGCLVFSVSVSRNSWASESQTSKPNSLPWNGDDEVEDGETEPVEGVGAAPLGCSERAALLRVYMYDLPAEFHYGMLVESEAEAWPRNVSAMPPYPGGLYAQHSPEYWLTSDLLTSTFPEREGECTAYRVHDWRLADVVFVPFFASLSYNRFTRAEVRAKLGDRNRHLQEKLVALLRQQPAWRASSGRDHVLVIHHPNSMHWVRDRLGSAMFVVADFGRYEPAVANVGKDVVAPYKHIVSAFPEDSTSFDSRTTLLFFQGAIHRKKGGVIRQQLYELLRDEPDVHFEAGNTTSAAIRSSTNGMRASKFCLNLAGDTPSSNRLFDAIASHCVPVVISDEIELPFEDDLDYSQFCVFVRSADALRTRFVIDLLRGVGRDEWTRMWRRIQEVAHHFTYQHPSQPDDAVHMTWKAIARKVPKLRLLFNKGRRYRIPRLQPKPSFLNWIP